MSEVTLEELQKKLEEQNALLENLQNSKKRVEEENQKYKKRAQEVEAKLSEAEKKKLEEENNLHELIKREREEKEKLLQDFSGLKSMTLSEKLRSSVASVAKDAIDAYCKNFNIDRSKNFGTITNIENLPKHDLMAAGVPCQSWSIAGRNLGFDDDRGQLWNDTIYLLQKSKPKAFIFENVKGLLSDDNGKTFSEWCNMLGGKSVNYVPVIFPYEESVPYHLYWKIINAKEHGVPQNRERVFLVGIRDDEDNSFRFPIEEHLTKRLKDILDDEVNDKYYLSEKLINSFITTSDKHKAKGNGFKFEPTFGEKESKTITTKSGSIIDDNFLWIADYRSDEGLRMRKDNISPCMTSSMRDSEEWNPKAGTRNPPLIGNNYEVRKLTPRECFRLMDFPDSFTWNCSDSQAYKQAGNSIVVNVLYKILKNLHLDATL